MNKRINLQDNIFVLSSRLKMLRDILILDTDPAIFMEKTMEDTNFIDQALETLLGHLRTHNRIFERDEALDYLSGLEWDFSRFLGEFSTGSGNISAASYPALLERIQLLRNRSAERLKEINADRQVASSSSVENTVSSDELNELLKDF
ncbi:MAG: hypothetical protein LBI94_08365 [Treponema sp.]|jgi:hypothetical protein|nr:hypothetical protein [Treponema sp.]